MERQYSPRLTVVPDAGHESAEKDINWANEFLLASGRKMEEARSVKSGAKVIDFGRIDEASRAKTQTAKEQLRRQQLEREAEYSQRWFKDGIRRNQQKSLTNITPNCWMYKTQRVTEINGLAQPIHTLELVEFTVSPTEIKKRVFGCETNISIADVDKLAHDVSIYVQEIPRELYGYEAGTET